MLTSWSWFCLKLREFSALNPTWKFYTRLFSCWCTIGLMRIGEVVTGTHTARAKDVHISHNKDKILIVLFSSKTHGFESQPKKSKLRLLDQSDYRSRPVHRFFCPFKILRQYMRLRGGFDTDDEPFFTFQGNVKIWPRHVRATLRQMLSRLNIEPMLYNIHSFRIRRSGDMLKAGYSFCQIKMAGRWRSNIIYKYLKQSL